MQKKNRQTVDFLYESRVKKYLTLPQHARQTLNSEVVPEKLSNLLMSAR